jgi:hypothetical protein
MRNDSSQRPLTLSWTRILNRADPDREQHVEFSIEWGSSPTGMLLNIPPIVGTLFASRPDHHHNPVR